MGKYRLGHIRMADDTVRRADQLFPGQATEGNELVVAVGDAALGIGGGDEALFCWEVSFKIGDSIDWHCCFLGTF
ncbi:hypothetical protein D9M71_696980 [compost metagenome]